eukprot:1144255-Pelagomonas_calceolata.AAC.10
MLHASLELRELLEKECAHSCCRERDFLLVAVWNGGRGGDAWTAGFPALTLNEQLSSKACFLLQLTYAHKCPEDPLVPTLWLYVRCPEGSHSPAP